MEVSATPLDQQLVQKTEAFAEESMRRLPEYVVFHNLKHTLYVAAAAAEISQAMGFGEREQVLVQLATLLHDLGFLETWSGHEEVSAQIAENFLREQQVHEKDIQIVLGCIYATRLPQNPRNRLEQVVCDADLSHLASEQFEENTERLRQELSALQAEEISPKKWEKQNRKFLEEHRYFTEYAQTHWTPGKLKNAKRLLKKKQKKDQEKISRESLVRPDRGIETLFRTTSANHISLSSIADSKANIMISVNAILLSVTLPLSLSRLAQYPFLLLPTIILSVVCCSTIVFAILATRPQTNQGTFKKEDILRQKTNLLFFGNFHNMTVEDYEWGMRQVMKDSTLIYGNLIRDIYSLGKVLGKKYRLLRITYTIFMIGLVLAILSYILSAVLYYRMF